MIKKQLTLAMLTSVLRSHQQKPLKYFKKIKILHFYSETGKDLNENLLDGSTIRHKGFIDLFVKLYKSNPDIIQGVEPDSFPATINEFIAGFVYSLIFNKPLICPAISNISSERRFGIFFGKIIKLIDKIYSKRVGLYFHYSDLAKKNYLKRGVDERKLIYNIWAIWGPDLHEFSPKPRQDDPVFKNPTIVFVGSLEEYKGIKDILNAFLIIKKQKPEVNLTIIGEGGLKSYIRTFIEDHSLKDSVNLLGAIKNKEISGHLRAATIFTLPSVATKHIEEQMGLSNIQSLACGTPVVTTKCGGIPEFIQNGVTGLVVPQRNPEKLATACLKLLENSPLRKKMAIAGRKYVESQFNPQKNVAEAEEIIMNWYKNSRKIK